MLARCLRALQASGTAFVPSLARALASQVNTCAVASSAVPQWTPLGPGFAAGLAPREAVPHPRPQQCQPTHLLDFRHVILMQPVPVLDLWPDEVVAGGLESAVVMDSRLSPGSQCIDTRRGVLCWCMSLKMTNEALHCLGFCCRPKLSPAHLPLPPLAMFAQSPAPPQHPCPASSERTSPASSSGSGGMAGGRVTPPAPARTSSPAGG